MEYSASARAVNRGGAYVGILFAAVLELKSRMNGNFRTHIWRNLKSAALWKYVCALQFFGLVFVTVETHAPGPFAETGSVFFCTECSGKNPEFQFIKQNEAAYFRQPDFYPGGASVDIGNLFGACGNLQHQPERSPDSLLQFEFFADVKMLACVGTVFPDFDADVKNIDAFAFRPAGERRFFSRCKRKRRCDNREHVFRRGGQFHAADSAEEVRVGGKRCRIAL